MSGVEPTQASVFKRPHSLYFTFSFLDKILTPNSNPKIYRMFMDFFKKSQEHHWNTPSLLCPKTPVCQTLRTPFLWIGELHHINRLSRYNSSLRVWISEITQLNGTVLENDENEIRLLGFNPNSTSHMIFEISPTLDYQPNEEETTKEQNQQQQQQSPGYYSNYDVWKRARDSDSEGDYEYERPLPAHKLVGLKNQGATCYLNSLVQVLYHTPDFRRMIYFFAREWDNLLAEKLKKISNRSVRFWLFLRNSELSSQANLKQPTSPRDNKDAKPEEKRDIILEMQLLFAKMQSARVSSVSTAGLTASFGWNK